jgi:hypothetical protein
LHDDDVGFRIEHHGLGEGLVNRAAGEHLDLGGAHGFHRAFPLHGRNAAGEQSESRKGGEPITKRHVRFLRSSGFVGPTLAAAPRPEDVLLPYSTANPGVGLSHFTGGRRFRLPIEAGSNRIGPVETKLKGSRCR